jgi:hypothetical protein
MIKNKKALFVAVALVATLITPDLASATALKQAGVRLGRLGISATANNDALVTFKLNNTPTSVRKIRVVFPASFTLTTGAVTVTVGSFPNTPASITSFPGTLTATSSNTTHDVIVTTTSSTLDATSLYGFYIPTGVITNPATAGQYVGSVDSQDTGGSQVDTTPVAMYIYGASANQDQVTVTASVSPTFTFALGANADTVPPADTSAPVTSPGVSLTITTNAPLGYTAYVKSSNAALTSSKAGSSIATGSFNGTPDSVVAVPSSIYTFVPSTTSACATSCGGSIAYDGEYNGITASTGGSFNTAGTFASFVSRTGYTGGDVFSLKERVAVTAAQAAANDYTDTLTVVAAGNY